VVRGAEALTDGAKVKPTPVTAASLGDGRNAGAPPDAGARPQAGAEPEPAGDSSAAPARRRPGAPAPGASSSAGAAP
jgi:hypothetical protein